MRLASTAPAVLAALIAFSSAPVCEASGERRIADSAGANAGRKDRAGQPKQGRSARAERTRASDSLRASDSARASDGPRRKSGGSAGPSKFALPVDAEAESRLRSEFGRRFSLRRTAHYTIAYDADPVVVAFHARLFEAVHDSFRAFFEAGGFRMPPLAHRLEAVMFAEREAFNAYARRVSPGLAAAAGFYSMRTDRIVLFDSFTDASYRKASANLTAAERNIAEVRNQLAVRKRGEQVILKYHDGSSLTLGRAKALRMVREKERELRAGRRELERHFADRNLTTTIHECVHQLAYNLGVQSPLADNPKWLGEGLATYFETMGYRAQGDSGQINPTRLDAWREAAAGGRLIPLERLIGDDSVFDVTSSSASTAYGQAWALVHYLLEKKPEPFFDYLRRTAASRRSGHGQSQGQGQSAERLRIFKAAFGNDLSSFDRRWRRYMSSQ